MGWDPDVVVNKKGLLRKRKQESLCLARQRQACKKKKKQDSHSNKSDELRKIKGDTRTI